MGRRGGASGRPGRDEATPGGARALLARFLREMQELGEDQVYLSPEGIRSVRSLLDRAAPRSRRASASDRAEPGVGRKRGPAGGSGRRGERRGGGGGRRTSGASSRRVASGGSEAVSSSRPRRSSVAEQAAAIAEPEIVPGTLAIGGGPATGDMFAPSSALDQCTALEDVERIAAQCEKCELSQGRTNVVFGVGNPNARLMFIGEAPGRDEDVQGIPFVGRAGKLLDRILEAAEIPRDSVYIGNIIKCRPPNNRTPLTNEIDACMPYLAKQLACIKPSVICTLGLPATQTLLGLKGSMASMRGKIYKCDDIVVVPTYHPAAALRDPRYKKPIWEDFLIVKREYDRAG